MSLKTGWGVQGGKAAVDTAVRNHPRSLPACTARAVTPGSRVVGAFVNNITTGNLFLLLRTCLKLETLSKASYCCRYCLIHVPADICGTAVYTCIVYHVPGIFNCCTDVLMKALVHILHMI